MCKKIAEHETSYMLVQPISAYMRAGEWLGVLPLGGQEHAGKSTAGQGHGPLCRGYSLKSFVLIRVDMQPLPFCSDRSMCAASTCLNHHQHGHCHFHAHCVPSFSPERRCTSLARLAKVPSSHFERSQERSIGRSANSSARTRMSPLVGGAEEKGARGTTREGVPAGLRSSETL